jgi:hypothetical protein
MSVNLRPAMAAHRWFMIYVAAAADHPEWERNDAFRALEARAAEVRDYDAMIAYIQWVEANDARDRITAEQDDLFETVAARAAAISEEVKRRVGGFDQ